MHYICDECGTIYRDSLERDRCKLQCRATKEDESNFSLCGTCEGCTKEGYRSPECKMLEPDSRYVYECANYTPAVLPSDTQKNSIEISTEAEVSTQLNPCPKCGDTKTVNELNDGSVLCEECAFESDSVEAWNNLPQPSDIKPCPICNSKGIWEDGYFICEKENCALHEDHFDDLSTWNAFPREGQFSEVGEIGNFAMYKGQPVKVTDWEHGVKNGVVTATVQLVRVEQEELPKAEIPFLRSLVICNTCGEHYNGRELARYQPERELDAPLPCCGGTPRLVSLLSSDNSLNSYFDTDEFVQWAIEHCPDEMESIAEHLEAEGGHIDHDNDWPHKWKAPKA